MDTEKDPEILKRNGVNYVHCACMASMLHQASQPLPEALAGGLEHLVGHRPNRQRLSGEH